MNYFCMILMLVLMYVNGRTDQRYKSREGHENPIYLLISLGTVILWTLYFGPKLVLK